MLEIVLLISLVPLTKLVYLPFYILLLLTLSISVVYVIRSSWISLGENLRRWWLYQLLLWRLMHKWLPWWNLTSSRQNTIIPASCRLVSKLVLVWITAFSFFFIINLSSLNKSELHFVLVLVGLFYDDIQKIFQFEMCFC